MTPNPPPDKDVDIELLRAYIKSKAPESEFNALWEPILSRLTTRTDTLQRENEEMLSKVQGFLEEAQLSFVNAKRPGFNANNWHLNAALCVDLALKAISDWKSKTPDAKE